MPHKVPVNTLVSCAAPGTAAFGSLSSVTSFRTVASALTAHDTSEYHAVTVDGSGDRTGDWESGICQWTGTNLIRTPYASSNSNALVNFTGTTYVMLAKLGGGIGGGHALNWWEWDFLVASGTVFPPYAFTGLVGGNLAGVSPMSTLTGGNHPGAVRLNVTTSANSGGAFRTQLEFSLTGKDVAETILYNTATTTLNGWIGAHNSTDHNTPTNAVCFRVVAGAVHGYTRVGSGTAATTTGTFNLPSSRWLRFYQQCFDSGNTHFLVEDDSGTRHLDEVLVASIPVATNQEVAFASNIWSSALASGWVCLIDKIGFGINKPLLWRP